MEAAQERILLHLEHLDLPRPAPVLRRWNGPNVRRNGRLAEPVLVPGLPPPLAAGLNPEEMLQAVVEDLRVNHDCQHTQWRYRDGGGRCVGCHDYLDRYVFVSVFFFPFLV